MGAYRGRRRARAGWGAGGVGWAWRSHLGDRSSSTVNLIGDFPGGQACGGAGAEGFAREHLDMQGFTRESYNSGGARATPILPHSRRHAPTAALEH